MPFTLPLPPGVPVGWMARIYDNELPEEPHVTVRFKLKFSRVSLRTGDVLDEDPPVRELNTDVYEPAKASPAVLAGEWDILHPHMKMNTASEKQAAKLHDKAEKPTKGSRSKRAEKPKGKKKR